MAFNVETSVKCLQVVPGAPDQHCQFCSDTPHEAFSIVADIAQLVGGGQGHR